MTAKNRARLLILSELMSFPTISNKDWQGSIGGKPQTGDLVSLTCAPPSKWYLSWLREIDPNNGWPKYLLESIEDGQLCWWMNVGLNVYDRERVGKNPRWKWTDGQFKFNDRWLKVCRRNDAYIVVPCQPKFNDDGSVLLDVRIRHGWDSYRNPRTFPAWRKVTTKEMDSYYKDCFEGYEAAKNAKEHATPRGE